MPNINVKIQDYRKPTVISALRDEFIVYVPGIVRMLSGKSYELLTDTKSFATTYYGSTIPNFTPADSDSDEDKQYLLAQNITYNYVVGLINCGYSVLFQPLIQEGVTETPTPVADGDDTGSTGDNGDNEVPGSSSTTTNVDPVPVKTVVGESFTAALEAVDFSDKILYDVTFLTDGGLTTNPKLKGISGIDNSHKVMYKRLISVANERKDCLVIPALYAGCSSDNATNFSSASAIGSSSEYCAAPYAPSVVYNSGLEMDAAYAFLVAYAANFAATSGNSVYLPPAGVNRMVIGDVTDVEYDVTSSMMEKWQNSETITGNSVNPIVYLRGYGYTVYGQRTLYSKLNHPYINLHSMLMICLITKKIHNVGTSITFEPNTLNTWTIFKSRIEAYLEKLLSHSGIYDYQVKLESIEDNNLSASVYVSFPGIVETISIDFYIAKGIVTFPDAEDGVNSSDTESANSNN